MLSQQSFNKLSAMGITLYQLKNEKSDDSPPCITIEPSSVQDLPIFIDILLALGISLGEVEFYTDKISLGTINWRFHKSHDISLNQQVLNTPELSVIEGSPQLKKQLWQVLNTQ